MAILILGSNGEPSNNNFKYKECEMPTATAVNEIYVESLYLSIDPAMVRFCQAYLSSNFLVGECLCWFYINIQR